MDRTLISETTKKVGKEVILFGWVDTIRDHGKITFLDLRDRTGIVQCVGLDLPKVNVESVVKITGKVAKRPEKLVNKKIETGSVEIQVKFLKVLSSSEELPFDMGVEKLELQLPTLLDNRTLSLRHSSIKDVFKVQEAVMEGFRQAAKDLDCTEIFVPTISASATEGGAEVFKVDYYGKEAFMIQSPQLYKQMMVPVFERVYLVSHAYRAEPSVTTRHLSESIQMDLELGFVEFEELMDALEYVGKSTLSYVSNKHPDILKEYEIEPPVFGKKIPRLKMREAQKIIKDRTGTDHTKEPDLDPEDEREISRWAKEEHGSDLVTVTHYPTKKRSFYTAPDPKNPEYSLSYDLIFRGVEILSGSQRINNHDELLYEMKKRKLNPDNFKMYLQAFKYGMPPEGGFSFGLERITMQLLKLSNVREASLFPRDMERVDFKLSSKKDSKLNKSEVYGEIIEKLNKLKIKYQKYEHDPVFTSEDSARVRGTSIHQGAKALVLQADKGLILLVMPADLKADLEKVKKLGGFDKLIMASKDTVKAKTGLEVGSVPPFGSLIGLKTYLDSRLSDNSEIAFNAGRHDRSIKMRYEDFVLIENPSILNI